jgi:hypothetical protein
MVLASVQKIDKEREELLIEALDQWLSNACSMCESHDIKNDSLANRIDVAREWYRELTGARWLE